MLGTTKASVSFAKSIGHAILRNPDQSISFQVYMLAAPRFAPQNHTEDATGQRSEQSQLLLEIRS